MTEFKPCLVCGKRIERTNTHYVWAKRKYCSMLCNSRAQRKSTPRVYIPVRTAFAIRNKKGVLGGTPYHIYYSSKDAKEAAKIFPGSEVIICQISV